MGDSKLPESCRSYDENDFLKNPKTVKATRMQIKMFQLHFQKYMDALSHILNTGQGVVMNRSVYSNFVFLEALVANKFVSKSSMTYLKLLTTKLNYFLFCYNQLDK